MNAFELDAFQSGAFQEEIAAGSFAFQECVFQDDAFQADTCSHEASQEEGGGGGRPLIGRRPRKWWEPEDEPIIAGIESKQALEIIEFEEQLIYEPMAEKVAINSDMIFEKLIQKHEKIKAQIQEEEDRIIELLLM